MSTKYTSPLELLDNGFESRLMCSLYLQTCHQDEAMHEMEKQVLQNSIESGSILNETYTMPNLDKAKVVAKLNNCLDLIQTPTMELEDEQAFLHTVLEHKMDDVVQTKRQNLPSPVSVLDYTNDMCYDSDESSCDESDNDETIASFWKKHREEKKDSEIENKMEVDVIAEKSLPVFPQKKMVLNDDEEQHDCSVFPWNIEHICSSVGIEDDRSRSTSISAKSMHSINFAPKLFPTEVFNPDEITKLVNILSAHIPIDDIKAKESPTFYAPVESFVSLRLLLLKPYTSYSKSEKELLEVLKQSWLGYVCQKFNEEDIANRIVREYVFLGKTYSSSTNEENRPVSKDSEIENEMEVDVIAEKSSPVIPQKKMVLNDDEEQHDCSVFPWNIEHDLIPTGKVKRAKQIKKEALVSNLKDGSSKKGEVIGKPTVVKKSH